MDCNHCKDVMDSYANTVLGTVIGALSCLQTKQQAHIACIRETSDLVMLIWNFYM